LVSALAGADFDFQKQGQTIKIAVCYHQKPTMKTAGRSKRHGDVFGISEDEQL
jgi:hypothetical protein